MGVICGPPLHCAIVGGYFCDQVEGGGSLPVFFWGGVVHGGGGVPFYSQPMFSWGGGGMVATVQPWVCNPTLPLVNQGRGYVAIWPKLRPFLILSLR